MGNVAALPWGHAEETPTRPAVRGLDRAWTYEELRERIATVGGAVRAAGIAPGDRVLLVAPSVPEFAALYYGVLAAGGVIVAMNTVATSYEIDYVLEDAGCTLVLAWHEAAEAAEQAAAARGLPSWRIGADLDGLPAGEPLAGVDEKTSEDTAVILYTSGTTGQPKGALLTHGNVRSCADAFIQVLRLEPDDVMGTALPLFHIFGGAVVMGTAMLTGASLTLLPKFDPREALKMIARDRVTVFCGVPTMYNALLQVTDVEADFSSLRLCASGGASLPDEVLREFTEHFGAAILEGYGMTETTGAATFNGLDRERKPGSVGIALPGCEVRIADADGNELPVGEVGEVLIRGPVIMKGYHGRPEATAETIDAEGWLHSGDLGTCDEDGDIRIVDRKKDLIIRGGYNVYPREVEEVLYGHPDIVEVAVVGVPDAHFGEEVGAVVALKPGADLEPAELSAWARERLSGYKSPRLFQFVDELPKGATGKILKRSIDRDGLERVASPAKASGPAA